MGRRLLFTLLVLCLVAPAARGDEYDHEYPEPMPLPVLVRDLGPRPGALWYAARVRVPRDAAIEWEIDAVGVPGWSVIGEFDFLFDEAGERVFASAGYGMLRPDGSYAVIRQGDIEVELSDERGASDEPGGISAWSRWYQREQDAAVVDLLVFPAANGQIKRTSITFRVDEGVEVLAESWGHDGTEIAREWDLEGGTYVRAGAGVPGGVGNVADALVVENASLTRRIDHHMTSWIIGSILAYPRARYAVTDPDGNVRRSYGVETDDGGKIVILDTVFTGRTPGAYTFTVEHFDAVEPPIRGGAYVLMAIADADFPACSTLPERRRAPEGHPICG